MKMIMLIKLFDFACNGEAPAANSPLIAILPNVEVSAFLNF